MNLVFKEQNKDYFEELWNKFLVHYHIDFQYSLPIIEYYLTTSSNIVADKSFVLELNNECVGICLLPIENLNGSLSISILGGYVMAPLASSTKNEQLIFSQIDALSLDLKLSVIKFKLSIFENSSFNKLRLYGFFDTTNTTCAINLEESQEQLWTNLRKSYKALINSLTKSSEYSLLYSDSSNFKDLHQHYVDFHKIHMLNAGKKPKSDAIYDKQLNLIEKNLATVIAVQYKNTIVMTDYFFHDTENAVYASSAYDTNEFFQNLPLNHYLLWHAMVHFKNLGFKTLGFGQPCNLNKIDGFNDYAGDKELNISHFKRGMGTNMASHTQGIKFFDKQSFLQFVEEFKTEIDTRF